MPMLNGLIPVRFVPAAVLLALAVAGCGKNVSPPSGASPSGEAPPALVAVTQTAQLPIEVQQAPAVVQAAYRYAVAHPEMLQAVGCYCGCGGMGHTSNYSCFVAGQDLTGATVYDGHALGCSICVDIARDVERLAAEGRDMRAIQEYIDAEYSKYGPSNLSR